MENLFYFLLGLLGLAMLVAGVVGTLSKKGAEKLLQSKFILGGLAFSKKIHTEEEQYKLLRRFYGPLYIVAGLMLLLFSTAILK